LQVDSIVKDVPKLEKAFHSSLRPPIIRGLSESNESAEGPEYDIEDVDEPVPSVPLAFTYSIQLD
jgi:hypothetical protein